MRAMASYPTQILSVPRTNHFQYPQADIERDGTESIWLLCPSFFACIGWWPINGIVSTSADVFIFWRTLSCGKLLLVLFLNGSSSL